jgi:acetyl esterase/lipase
MTHLLLAIVAPLCFSEAPRPKEELLWPKGAPGAVGTLDQDKPTLTAYLPEKGKANGTAVVVCPGGGYGGLALGHEGVEIADWLTKRGVAAFVLKYRLGPRYRHPVPLQDAQRAMRMVRAGAKEMGIKPNRIGIWGFSAGGHLASTAATKFDDGDKEAKDSIDRQSCRPNFAILCYPVISMAPPFTHMGSRQNLLGNKPDAKLVKSVCNELNVTAKTPPTFLFHTSEDTVVPPENSVLFYQALRKAKVPAELHIYEKGVHGVGLASKDPVLSSWPDRLEAWLKLREFLPKPSKKARKSSRKRPTPPVHNLTWPRRVPKIHFLAILG